VSEATERYRRAAARWPMVSVDASAFERNWAERSQRQGGRLEEGLAEDVYLAAAIEAGDREAIVWLQEAVARAARAAAGSSDVAADTAAEVVAKVAVGQGEGPWIRRYGATGPLRGWLAVVTARAVRANHPTPEVRLEDAVLEELGSASASSDKRVLLARFAPHIRPALAAASERLPTRDRALLSLHYLKGVGLEELARSYQVHRVTVSRWLVAAREGLLEAVRDELSLRVGVPRLDVDSLVRTLSSQFDLSLRRLWDSQMEAAR